MHYHSIGSAAVAVDPAFAPTCLHRAGQLEVRLAATADEVTAAQALRYRIFYEEMGAVPSRWMASARLDFDTYDAICDHLVVLDHGWIGQPQVVGTYRLLRQEVADAHGGFYSAGEFDLAALIGRGEGQLLELGRSCVDAEYRNNATITLLWRGIASYLERHRISHMIGCASLAGTDAAAHAAELSYLHHHHLAPQELRATVLPDCRAPFELLAPGSYDARAALRALPPLVKGYLRVGAMVGEGAFVDHQFNTTDVFIVVPVDRITGRYSDRFRTANDAM